MMHPGALALTLGTIALTAGAVHSAPAPIARSAPAPMTVKSAQQELLRLAAPRVEAMDGKVSKGVFVRTTITFPTACTITQTIVTPAYRYGGRDFAAQTVILERYFFEHKILIYPDHPNNVVFAENDRLKDGGRYFAAKSPADAQRAKQVIEWLAANCREQGTRTNHKVIGGAMTCMLRALPTLRILDLGTQAFSFYLPSTNGQSDGLIMVGFSTNSDPQQLTIGAYTAVPYFYLPKTAVPKGTSKYIFYVDGRELLFPLKVVEKDGKVSVAASTFPAMLQLFRALAKGKTLSVRAFDSRPSMVGEWTYDLSTMRNLEATVKSTVRRC